MESTEKVIREVFGLSPEEFVQECQAGNLKEVEEIFNYKSKAGQTFRCPGVCQSTWKAEETGPYGYCPRCGTRLF